MLQIFCLTVLFSHLPLAKADAKVDGFFKESLVKEGYFPDSQLQAQKSIKESRPSFFISREERRLNPDKAPSNNIVLPQHSIRLRTQSIGIPTRWGNQVYSSGVLINQ